MSRNFSYAVVRAIVGPELVAQIRRDEPLPAIWDAVRSTIWALANWVTKGWLQKHFGRVHSRINDFRKEVAVTLAVLHLLCLVTAVTVMVIDRMDMEVRQVILPAGLFMIALALICIENIFLDARNESSNLSPHPSQLEATSRPFGAAVAPTRERPAMGKEGGTSAADKLTPPIESQATRLLSPEVDALLKKLAGDPKAAREFLVAAGIHDADGKLRPEYK